MTGKASQAAHLDVSHLDLFIAELYGVTVLALLCVHSR